MILRLEAEPGEDVLACRLRAESIAAVLGVDVVISNVSAEVQELRIGKNDDIKRSALIPHYLFLPPGQRKEWP